MASWPLPLVAAVVGYVFAAMVWAQWVYRRKPSQLAWALGLTCYAAASGIDAWVSQGPWNVPLYRLYFVLAAANVGLLGAGTVLLVRKRWGRVFGRFVAIGALIALFAPWALPLSPDMPVDIDGHIVAFEDAGTELGGKAIPFSNPGRIAFLLLNVIGGLALIGGALASWWSTRRPGVLLIGVGAMMPFLGGSASTLAGLDARILLQFLGVVVMFAGFVLGNRTMSQLRGEVPIASD